MYVLVPILNNPFCIRPRLPARGSFGPRGVLSALGVSFKPKPMCVRACKG